MKFLRTLLVFLFVSTLPVMAYSDDAFRLSQDNITIKPGGEVELKLDVYLPKNQHLYIKPASSMSFNIPTSFKIKDQGFAVEVVEYPNGEKKEDDFVLKGRGSTKAGTYTLKIFETEGKAAGSKTYALKLEIKTQWCDSKTNVCFRPNKIVKKLSAKITGSKDTAMRFGASAERSGINWVTSYNSAFQQAKQSGQNVFVVITAPTWCGYCKMLERDVFAKDSVHSVLNSKFVALRILDSNPDKSKFNFRGYPTMMVANSSGQILTQSIPRREDSFLTALKKYETSGGGNGGSEDNKPLSGESYNYSIKVNGTFKRTADGQWIETKETTGEKVSYKEVRRDSNYIVIQNVSTKTFLALPVRSSKGFIYENGKWKPYLDFSK